MNQHDKDVTLRVREVVRQSGMTQAEFARRIGIDPANMSKYLTGRLAVSDALINRITLELGVGREWLRTGEGPLREPRGEMPQGAPVYDIDVTAGPVTNSLDFASDEIIGYLNIPGIGNDVAFVHTSGDSMEPVIHNKALLGIREVTVGNEIFWGQIYVVLTDDYRMVKFVRRNREDPSQVILHSANSNYDDMDMPLSRIRRLFLVQNILNIDIRY